jgi:hypothetical protein
MQSCIDHAAADGPKNIRFKDLAIDLFVELVFEVPDILGHFVFDADKADGFLLRSSIGSDIALLLLFSQEFCNRLVNQWMENFRSGFMATDEIFVGGF